MKTPVSRFQKQHVEQKMFGASLGSNSKSFIYGVLNFDRADAAQAGGSAFAVLVQLGLTGLIVRMELVRH